MANSEIAIVMENPEEKAKATLLAENPKVKVTSNNPDSNSEDIKEESAVEDNHESSIWSQTVEETPKVESFFQNYWKKMFVASCLCGVLVDPLFLYIPIIKDDIKCLLDQKLKIATVILRSITDFFYILDIVFRIYGSKNYLGFIEDLRRTYNFLRLRVIRRSCVPTIAKAIWGSNDILIDILAILPLPQVAKRSPPLMLELIGFLMSLFVYLQQVVVLIFFSNMRDLRSFTTTRMFIMNLFALLQYVPRVLRIYFSCSELKRIPKDEIKQTPIWIKAILNFSMYIIASHVFGAVWYFFSIQRMMECWHSACRKEDGCDIRTFGCHDHHTFKNISILNYLCPINPSNVKIFDLGIFTSVLESDITGSTNYFQKLSNCFWWGLRNLSSLGSNLEPSIDGWENLFTASISIIGLLLFLYLIGNLQMYMQFETAKVEGHNRKLLVKRKTEQLGGEIELWLFKNGIPTRSHKDMKLQVMEKVRQAIEGNVDVTLDDILDILPSDFQSRIKNCRPLTKLKRRFPEMDVWVLKEICQHLQPKKFKKNDIILEFGKPIEMMVFIVDGFVRTGNISDNDTYNFPREFEGEELSRSEDSSNHSTRAAGKLFGEDLLIMCGVAIESVKAIGGLQATETVKANGDVEALVLTAKDMGSLPKKIGQQIDILRQMEILRTVATLGGAR